MKKEASKKQTKTNVSNGQDAIVIKGARTHNLKNVDLTIPRGKMIVFTGLSGSGKSSLAFDTIFAEGQRRYVESLSAYARQFLRQMQKPDLDEISGLSPAISIDQKSASRNPRSTVATITEIYDYLRILYARVGQPYCLHEDVPIRKLSHDEILRIILDTVESKEVKEASEGDPLMGVPISSARVAVFAPVVVGRKGEHYQLLYDLLNRGYETVRIDGQIKQLRERIELTKNKRHNIDVLIDEIYVSEFRDSPKSARERLSEGVELALELSGGLVKIESPDGESRILSAKFMCPNDGSSFPEVEPRLFSFNSPFGACEECNGLGMVGIFQNDECPSCHGARLRPEALRVYLKAKDSEGLGANIHDFTSMTVKDAMHFVQSLDLSDKDMEVAWPALREVIERLTFMDNVGIEYLTLNRRANTLSGGEAQRIRLASQLGSGLVGALYVLDEPTIGLHQRDNDRLIKTLTNLRDLGNTILVVEHDEDTIRAADFLVDVGPGAGVHGGDIVVADDLQKLLTQKTNPSGSLTVDYLRGTKRIEVPEQRRTKDKGALKVRGGNVFNIKDLDVDVPLGKFVTITGVSGSGKSTFMYEILNRNLRAGLEKRYRTARQFNVASVSGMDDLSRVVLIDQSPIGRTPRSNPATYTGAFTHIRNLFAATGEARARGWKPGRFSFNVKGGRCEACQGNGQVAVEMHFLPTVFVTCDVCDGKRFTKETLEVTYKGKNIHDVLEMTVEEAYAFFQDIPAIADRLSKVLDVGLSYLALGQSATTLSGGEAQRIKIAAELYRPDTYKTMYLLDEPTVGLHYEDVRKLIEILQALVDRGNSVAVIEHNLDLIKSSDYILDFGPEGGAGGGQVVAKGTPEEVATQKDSPTGEYLKKMF